MKAYKKFKNALFLISIVCVFIMMIYITIDVLTRNFTNTALVGTYEIIGNFLMPIAVFLSIPYTYTSGVMPKIVMLTDKMNAKKKMLFSKLCHLISLVVFAALGYFSLLYAFDSTADMSAIIVGSSLTPIYPLHYLPALAFFMIVFEDLLVLISKEIEPL